MRRSAPATARSRRSGSSSSRAVAARRHSAGHGSGSPSAVAAASERQADDTPRALHGGRRRRATCAASSSPRAVQAEPPERVRAHPAHPPQDRPARGERPAAAVRALDRRGHRGHPGGLAERRAQPLALGPRRRRRHGRRRTPRRAARPRRADVGGEARDRRLRAAHAADELARSASRPSPVRRRDGEHRDAVSPSASSSRAQVGAARGHRLGGRAVSAWLSTTSIGSRCGASGRR